MPRKVMCNHTEICFSSFQAAGKLATKAQIHNFCESRWIGVPSCVPDLERSCEGEALSVALTSGGVFSIGCGPQGCFHSPSEVKNPPAMQGTQRRGFDPWAAVHGVAKNPTQRSYWVGTHGDPNPHDSQDSSFLSELSSPSIGPQACMHVRHWVREEFVIYFWIAACEKLIYMWVQVNRMLKCLFSC